MMGIMLVAVSCIMLATVTAMGNVVLVKHGAQSAADLGAIAAAQAWQESTMGASAADLNSAERLACHAAAETARNNEVGLRSCSVTDGDADITVVAVPAIAGISQVTATAVAGPRDCQ